MLLCVVVLRASLSVVCVLGVVRLCIGVCVCVCMCACVVGCRVRMCVCACMMPYYVVWYDVSLLCVYV